MRKFTLLFFILAIGIYWSCKQEVSVDLPKETSFYIVGDWGRMGQYAQTSIAKQMDKSAKLTPIDFIFSTGDNFYENGVADVNDAHWKQSFEQVYSGSNILKNWYITLGNHDYMGNPTAQLDYAKINKRWILPNRYYSFVREMANNNNVRFVIIDTTPLINEHRTNAFMHSDILSQDTQKQLKWLDSTLSVSKEKIKIVVGHHPMYSAGTGRGDQAEIISIIKPLLNKYKVQLYISSHSHNSQYLKAPDLDTELLVSGGAAYANDIVRKEHPYLLFGTNTPAFTSVKIKDNLITASFVDSTGKVLYSKDKLIVP